jgi:hypothetical protein
MVELWVRQVLREVVLHVAVYQQQLRTKPGKANIVITY